MINFKNGGETMTIYLWIIVLIGIASWILVGIKAASRIAAREFKKELKKENNG
jgi:biopolymer transport protein ExbB/TolQ